MCRDTLRLTQLVHPCAYPDQPYARCGIPKTGPPGDDRIAPVGNHHLDIAEAETEERVLYTAEAHVTGGRANGHGRTSDGALEVDLRAQVEMGGEGGGTNPEQLFAVGFAACFESSLMAVARRDRDEAEAGDVAIDSKVMLEPTRERGFKLAVELDITLPSVSDVDKAAELVRAADQVCPYSNATRGNVDVRLIANGQPVEH